MPRRGPIAGFHPCWTRRPKTDTSGYPPTNGLIWGSKCALQVRAPFMPSQFGYRKTLQELGPSADGGSTESIASPVATLGGIGMAPSRAFASAAASRKSSAKRSSKGGQAQIRLLGLLDERRCAACSNSGRSIRSR
jgi:hypothetical protein